MVDGASAAGLASAIVAFLDVAYKVGKRTKEFSRTTGTLPTDIGSAKELMDVIVKSAERINARLSINGGSYGPPTEWELALATRFNELNTLSNDLLAIVDKLNLMKNNLSKAIVSIRKERKVEKIRSEMDRIVLSITYLLVEEAGASAGDLLDIATELRKNLVEFHRSIEAKMSTGFQKLSDEVDGSKEKVLSVLQNLLSQQQAAAETSHDHLLSGQQDISQSLHAINQLITIANSPDENAVARRLERLFSEQREVMRSFQQTNLDLNSAMACQLAALERQIESLLKPSQKGGDAAEWASTGFEVRSQKAGIFVRTEFEFSFHQDIISIHIEHCLKWTSEKLFPSLRLSLSLLTGSVPTVHVRKIYAPTPLSIEMSETTVDIMFRHQKGQFKRFRIDFTDENYGGDLERAIRLAHYAHRGKFWSFMGVFRLSEINYVQYDSYSQKLGCFLHVEQNLPAGKELIGLGYLRHRVSFSQETYGLNRDALWEGKESADAEVVRALAANCKGDSDVDALHRRYAILVHEELVLLAVLGYLCIAIVTTIGFLTVVFSLYHPNHEGEYPIIRVELIPRLLVFTVSTTLQFSQLLLVYAGRKAGGKITWLGLLGIERLVVKWGAVTLDILDCANLSFLLLFVFLPVIWLT